MHFDFVDIGTCDFETSADEVIKSDGKTALLVEPLKFYLDNLPVHKNILKVNVAVSNVNSTATIFYLDEKTILKYDLPPWLRGCSSLNNIHPAAEHHLKEKNLSTDLVLKKDIKVITFFDLCETYDIQSIGQIKIDTEGYDHIILSSVLKKIKNGLDIKTIIFEYQEFFQNTKFLDSLILLFEKEGYKKFRETNIDMRLEK